MQSWIVAGIRRGSGNDSEQANEKLQTDREARRLSFALLDESKRRREQGE
jgi:hypothetical protein